MNRASQRKLVLALGGAFAAAVAVTVAVFREDLAREMHLVRLRGTPSLLEQWIVRSDQKRAAALRFLREPAGRAALFQLYLDEYDKTQPGFSNSDFLKRVKDGGVRLGSMSLWPTGYSCQTWTGTGGSSFSIGNMPTSAERRSRILELLDFCVGHAFRTHELPRLEFELRPVVDGDARPPTWSGAERIPLPTVREGVGHVCFFRVLGNEP